MKKNTSLFYVFAYAFLVIMFSVSVFPFLWMLIGMTNQAVDIVKGKMTFGTFLIDNFNILFNQYDVKRILFNSCRISILVVIGQLTISSMAAYGFEIYSSKARDRVFGMVILSMMIPFAALMIPLFRFMVKVHLMNSFAGVVLPSLASVFLIFFFRQSFKSFPREIIQAARVDGASEFRLFFSMVIPSMKATYAAGAIYSFMTSWNAYMWPLIVLQTNEQQTMQLLIQSIASAYVPEYGAIMMAIVISTLPMIFIFFTLQNYFVQGITGSVKQ